MRLFAIALLFAAGAFAQQRVSRIVPVKNADPGRLLDTVRQLGYPVNATRSDNSIVLAGAEDQVSAVEALVKSLDAVQPKLRDIEITGYVILASIHPEATAQLPSDLEPVVRQFHNLLTYKSFRVLDTILLRAQENRPAMTGGFLPVPDAPAAGDTINFHVDKPAITDTGVHLGQLGLRVLMPNPSATRDVVIATDADVKTNQKIAIGKASFDAAGDALILVVSAKVVD